MNPPQNIVQAAEDFLKKSLHFEFAFSQILHCEVGWIFVFNSKRYIEEGDRLYFMWGCSPFLVVEKDLSIHKLGHRNPQKNLNKLIEQYSNE